MAILFLPRNTISKEDIVAKADANIVHTATIKRQDYSKRIKRNDRFST